VSDKFSCSCGVEHDISLRALALECAAYETNGVELCRLDVAEDLHKQIIGVALVADRLEHEASTKARMSRRSSKDGDKAGAVREWCIAAREYDWAADLWGAIGWHERAAKCRSQSDAVRAGEWRDDRLRGNPHGNHSVSTDADSPGEPEKPEQSQSCARGDSNPHTVKY
jgi:hypothetical protein